MSIIETVEKEINGNPEGAIIWLHGLGADGHDFESIIPALDLPRNMRIRFVFPHAPFRSITINNGIKMRAWYDVLSLDRSEPQDEYGIRESAEILNLLIERERERGIDYNRIVVAGFSQGGAIAIHAALRFHHKLAGLLALSTWLPLDGAIEEEVTLNNKSQSRDLPIFLAHGSFDPILPVNLSHESRNILHKLNYKVDWHEYPIAHSVSENEIKDISFWLQHIFLK